MNINKADGWVKSYKKMMFTDLWDDNNAYVAFTKFLLMAHHEDDFASIRFKGKQRHLKAGEFAGTTKEIAEYLNLSVGTLRNVIKRLIATNRIALQTDNHITVISICNWPKYQGDENKPVNKRLSKPLSKPLNTPTSEQKNKEIKNIYKKREIGVSAPSELKDYSEVREPSPTKEKIKSLINKGIPLKEAVKQI